MLVFLTCICTPPTKRVYLSVYITACVFQRQAGALALPFFVDLSLRMHCSFSPPATPPCPFFSLVKHEWYLTVLYYIIPTVLNVLNNNSGYDWWFGRAGGIRVTFGPLTDDERVIHPQSTEIYLPATCTAWAFQNQQEADVISIRSVIL